jgi:hypothetical protein
MKDSQWPGQTVRFLESPAGLSVLHRIITAAHLIFVQAKAIICYAEVPRGAPHSPDLFHVQQDTSRGLSLPLASQSRRAEERQSKTPAKVADLQAQRDACREPGPESSQGLEQALQQARAEEAAAGEHLSACRDRQQRATEARRAASNYGQGPTCCT